MIEGIMIWDTHIHIVPGVDDGARTIEEAIEMLRMEKRQGVDYIFATPHSMAFDRDIDRVHRSFEELQHAAYEAGIEIGLDLGCEMFCHVSNINDCIRKIKNGIYPTFGHYVLTEFPTYKIGINEVIMCLSKIQDAGYTPIIAHAERYAFSNVSSISKLRDNGALVQINAYSMTRNASPEIRKLATELVKFEQVDFVGSDAHRLDHRQPVIAEGVERIIQMTSREYATMILASNPKARLLRDC